MKKRLLQPEQILVPGEYELGNESILKIYFRIFEKGHGNCLPPVVVMGADVVPESEKEEHIQEIIRQHYEILRRDNPFLPETKKGESYDLVSNKFYLACEFLKGFDFFKAKEHCNQVNHYYLDFVRFRAITRLVRYLLLDGNHRTAAATLTHKRISALELQTDDDLAEVRRMVERGELFDFKRPETELKSLIAAFYDFCKDRMDDFNTVKQRIDELASNGDLPQYMKDRYLRVS